MKRIIASALLVGGSLFGLTACDFDPVTGCFDGIGSVGDGCNERPPAHDLPGNQPVGSPEQCTDGPWTGTTHDC